MIVTLMKEVLPHSPYSNTVILGRAPNRNGMADVLNPFDI
jgi:hypothetical protein